MEHEPIKILFIDDNSTARILGEILRESHGFHVTMAKSINDAKYFLECEPGKANYDYVIVDVTINGRHGGWELAKELAGDKDSPNYPHDKIIIYSARINEIHDEMKANYPNIRYLDKRNPNILSEALALLQR